MFTGAKEKYNESILYISTAPNHDYISKCSI